MRKLCFYTDPEETSDTCQWDEFFCIPCQ
jgi:hypothetical protein